MRRWFEAAPVIATVGIAAAGLALLLPLRAGLAWGLEGHRAVALIADRLLQQAEPAARAKVQTLLATDKDNRLTKHDIAAEATWADVLRDKSPEARLGTSAWHTVRFKPDNPDLATACFGRKPLPAGYPASRGPQDNCVVDKLIQFEAELKNPETSQFQKVAALQFLLNLVGDVSDPLNAIDRGDQGGYCTAVQIGSNPPVRLSNYWEETLVRQVLGGNAAQGAAKVAAGIPADARSWSEGTPESWARDSYEVAKSVTYAFTAEQAAGQHQFPAKKGETEPCPSVALYRVGPEYERNALAAVQTQLAKGGVRLARVLRDSFK
jgi:hypothetical protein